MLWSAGTAQWKTLSCTVFWCSYLPTSLSSEFQTSPRQVTSLTSSARKTAVVEMNMSPGLISWWLWCPLFNSSYVCIADLHLVLAYRMDRPNTAFCPVSVTRLEVPWFITLQWIGPKIFYSGGEEICYSPEVFQPLILLGVLHFCIWGHTISYLATSQASEKHSCSQHGYRVSCVEFSLKRCSFESLSSVARHTLWMCSYYLKWPIQQLRL